MDSVILHSPAARLALLRSSLLRGDGTAGSVRGVVGSLSVAEKRPDVVALAAVLDTTAPLLGVPVALQKA